MSIKFDELYPVEVGARLKDERTRIGLATQADAAKACGVSREMWGQYERGKTLPGSEALARFALLGGDVQHVLTGSVSINYSNSSPLGPVAMGKRIAFLRGSEAKELFAQMVEVDVPTLEACEAGLKTPSASMLLSICRWRNVNLDWLLRGVGKPSPPEYDPLFLSLVTTLNTFKNHKPKEEIDEVRALEREVINLEREMRSLTKENADLRIEKASIEMACERLKDHIRNIETESRQYTDGANQSFNNSQINNVAGRDVVTGKEKKK